jgi:NADH dehydrogenase FAD-containing subunit
MAMKSLVLLGGGHTHLYVLARTRELTDRSVDVTLISPSNMQYYSGMAPGVMGCYYAPEDLQADAGALIRQSGGRFVEDSAVRIDPEGQTIETAGGARFRYDVLSCNIGSSVPVDAVEVADETLWGRMVFRTKPIRKLLRARERMIELLAAGKARCVVIGCGPAAAELAGNVWRLAQHCAEPEAPRRLSVTVVCSSELLSGRPRSFRGSAAHSLVRRGIEVVHNTVARRIDAEGVHCDGGTTIPADVVLIATGVSPPPLFRDSGLPVSDDGALLVEATLQSVAYERILGAGDCISFVPRRIRRVGVHAVREQPVLHHNLQRLLGVTAGGLRRYRPQEHYLFALNMGDGTGVAMKWGIPFRGRLAFRMKDRLDRRFIRMYQRRIQQGAENAT